jgi:hypothetical protein
MRHIWAPRSRSPPARPNSQCKLISVRLFESPDPALIDQWGEDVLFRPAAGGEYTVQMIVSQNSPDPDVQPPPILCLFGTLDDSGFSAVDAPKPIDGDVCELDDHTYLVYLVKENRSGGSVETNAFWVYLAELEA